MSKSSPSSSPSHASPAASTSAPGSILVDGKLPSFKFSLGAQSPVVYPGGTAKQVTAVDFPVSKSIAGVSMTLEPGGLRELHWHANAAEWAYVFEGNLRVTILDPEGRSEVADFAPGDIWYFPRGHGHSIQGLGPGTARFLLVFDNGYFSEFATFSVTDWIARTPKDIVAKNLGLPVDRIDAFPTKEVCISSGPVPPEHLAFVEPVVSAGEQLRPPRRDHRRAAARRAVLRWALSRGGSASSR